MDELGSPRRRGGAGQWGDDTGAALVEMAMALVLLVMLLVGMVSAGIAYNNQLALTHAAREGGRYAATLPVNNFGSIGAWLADVSSQTIQDATGSLDTGVSGRYVCVAYVYPGGVGGPDPDDRTSRYEVFADGSTNSDGQQCITGGDGRPANERRVQVVVERQVEINAILFSPVVTLDAEAVNRFEASQ
jgi:hypothetical protein